MKTSQKPLDSRCVACLLVVLVIVLILEPITLFFAGFFLWIWANNDGKNCRRRRNRSWLSYDAINKPHWSDSSSYSSSSSSGGMNNDTVSNPAYSYLGSNIYHK